MKNKLESILQMMGDYKDFVGETGHNAGTQQELSLDELDMVFAAAQEPVKPEEEK